MARKKVTMKTETRIEKRTDGLYRIDKIICPKCHGSGCGNDTAIEQGGYIHGTCGECHGYGA